MPLVPRFVLQHQQQRQDLNRLAEPHVVGKAGPKPELCEQMKPLHARLLIGPQCALKVLTGVDAQKPIGMAQSRECLRQPRTGHGLAPVDVGLPGAAITGNAGSGQHAHRLTERQTIGDGAALDGLELLECPAQSFMIDLDPLAAYQGQPVGLRQELLDLGRRESFAVERDLHPEVEQRIHPQL